MNPTKKIKINGKLVMCRALEVGETRNTGDVYRDGSKWQYYHNPRQMAVNEERKSWQAYRPLPTPKRKKAGVKVKGVRAWVCVGFGGIFSLQDVCSTRERALFEAGRWNDHNTMPKDPERRRVIPVLIIPIGKATK